jgi:hypothetical protein
MLGYIQSNHYMYKRLMKVIGTCHMEKQKGDSKQAVDYCKSLIRVSGVGLIRVSGVGSVRAASTISTIY